MSKLDAEYELWKLEQNQKEIRYCSYGFSNYSVKEVDVMTIEKGKDFKKFIEQKKNTVKNEIQKEKDCKESDLVDITKYEKELEELNKI